MEVANPLLETFGEPQRHAWQIPAVPQQISKEKETQTCQRFVQTIGLLAGLAQFVF